MNIAISGASGFVGKNLSEYLGEKGAVVNSLSLRSPKWEKNKILTESEAIIHLAGKAHDTSNISNPEEYFRINRDLTIKLFDSFLHSDAADFLYFSSVKAVADSVTVILTEEIPPNPLTVYGKSKLEAEKYLLDQPLPPGKRLFILRPCMIHGPGNKGNLNLLYRVVKLGIPWPLVAFNNKRSFLSIDNLNFIIDNLLKDKSVFSGIYNLADDEGLSSNEVVDIISKTIGKKKKLWNVSKKLILQIAKIGDKLNLPLNSSRLKKLTENYLVSNEKIKSTLNIEKLPITASEGLKKTIKSFNKKK